MIKECFYLIDEHNFITQSESSEIFDSCSEVLVVGSEDLPSLLAHEAGGRVDTVLGHLSHA